MMSCILVLYIALFAVPAGANPSRMPPAGSPAVRVAARVQDASDADPDALYAKREDLASATAAADIWAARLQKRPDDFEAAWKLARARYWLGGHAPQTDRKRLLEAGIEAGRAAVTGPPRGSGAAAGPRR